jgi:flagellar biosynthesis/type III secretory pathway M-ring protein FliF/YscJ
VEIKIGVQDTAREVSLDSNDTSESVIAAVNEALASGGILSLVDDRGRTVMVPAAKIAYVEVGASSKGRVGFGS